VEVTDLALGDGRPHAALARGAGVLHPPMREGERDGEANTMVGMLVNDARVSYPYAR
jgi:hypothetical protein